MEPSAADEPAAVLDFQWGFGGRLAPRHGREMQGRGLTVAIEPVPDGADLALEFVRFCYRRRHVAWPALYDEMSVVAGHGLFRGMGYADLAERGVSLCLGELPRMAVLTERVIREEAPTAEPLPEMATLTLVPAAT
ncbi:MAG TPA: hypothetical protein VM284_00090 [Candidatus Limnocylindria bacterium]|nr:hypothetical protein [Candidatus Limnocylindria bacterium]